MKFFWSLLIFIVLTYLGYHYLSLAAWALMALVCVYVIAPVMVVLSLIAQIFNAYGYYDDEDENI